MKFDYYIIIKTHPTYIFWYVSRHSSKHASTYE